MDDLTKVTVVASRSHWRAGVYFKQGQPITLGACENTFKRLVDDPELAVSPAYEQVDEYTRDQANTANLNQKIAAAVQALKTNPENLTREGDVKVDAVCEHLGFTVTRKQIDEAIG